MELVTFAYDPDAGWSEPLGSDLDSPQTLLMVFGAREYLEDPEPLGELVEAYPEAVKVGCSSSGEIFGNRVSDGSLSVAVARLESGSVRRAVAPIDQMEESAEVGHRLGEELAGDDLSAALVFSQGVNVNGTALVEGMNRALDASVPVSGGLAGDGDRFEKTWVLDENEPRQDVITAVGLYGDAIRVSHGSQGGWDQFGPEREVTRSEGNVLYELDGKPALDLYKRYLGAQADDLPASALLFPLEIVPPNAAEPRLVRTILGIDEEEQSMTFAGDIPTGSRARLMKANFDRLIEGASGAAQASTALSDHDGETLGIAVSCVGRRLVLKERTEGELDAALEHLPDGTELVGFYSYGELSPLEGSQECALHNQTMTLTLLSETQ